MLKKFIKLQQPDFIFHLAAQSLVKKSYKDPLKTWSTNTFGTINILESLRLIKKKCIVVLITSDKAYENLEIKRGYKENDRLGGKDPYSASKAAADISISSYINSFFSHKDNNVFIATARAGNVIGGGDWSTDRLIPDIAIATSRNEKVLIRNPLSIRPWQHVLDCLHGYLLLGAKLLHEETDYAEAWNFSPFSNEAKNVKEIAGIAQNSWDNIKIEFGTIPGNFHEAGLLVLDNSKAISKLKWMPVWNTTEAVQKTIEWYKAYYEDNRILTRDNIIEYLKSIEAK